MFNPAESRQVMRRWAFLLAAALIVSLLLNMSFAQYLVALREGDPDTHLDRAEALKNAPDPDFKAALVSVENALDRAPLYPRAHKVQGDILLDQKEWAAAEAAYRMCLDLGGTYDGVQNNVLVALIQQEEYDEAIALGKRFLEWKDVSEWVPRYLAEACLRAQYWKEALSYLKQALRSNPKDLYLLGNLRMIYDRLGMTAEEAQVLETINEIEMERERKPESPVEP